MPPAPVGLAALVRAVRAEASEIGQSTEIDGVAFTYSEITIRAAATVVEGGVASARLQILDVGALEASTNTSRENVVEVTITLRVAGAGAGSTPEPAGGPYGVAGGTERASPQVPKPPRLRRPR